MRRKTGKTDEKYKTNKKLLVKMLQNSFRQKPE